MEAAGDLVGVVIELAASVQLGHHDLKRATTVLMHTHRDATTVVRDRDRVIDVNLNRHCVAMTCERLIHRVIDDLEDHVMQTRAVIGVADVHSRALSHRLKPLQHLDAIGVVIAVCEGVRAVFDFGLDFCLFSAAHGRS